MYYNTNTISDRFNINKGWKSSSFPETLSFYANDNVFLFKIFLFLKAYFAISRIILISCEIRLAEEHTPVLYLVINTTYRSKNKKKTAYSGLKYSSLYNPKAWSLIFMNLLELKQILCKNSWFLLKKKPSYLWLTKPRVKTWLNFVNVLRINRRNYFRPNSQHSFLPTTFKVYPQKIQRALQLRLSQVLKEKLLLITILKLLKISINLIPKLLKFYRKRLKTFSKKIKKIQTFFLKINKVQNLKKKKNKFSLLKQNTLKSQLLTYQQRKFKGFYQFIFQRCVVKKGSFKQYLTLSKKKKIMHKMVFILQNKHAGFPLNKQNKFIYFILNLTSWHQKYKAYKNYFINYSFLLRLLKNIRFQKKTKLKLYHVIKCRKNNMSFSNLNLALSRHMARKVQSKITKKSKKVKIIFPKLNYRESFRTSYRNYLNILIRYQYKLWIQKLLQTFFKTRFEVKFIQPLTQYNNLKFLRKFYPIKKKFFGVVPVINSNRFLFKKKKKFMTSYIYIGTNLKQFARLSKLHTKKRNKLFNGRFYTRWKKVKSKAVFTNTNNNLAYQLTKYMSIMEFLPILTLSMKYLNPKILADFIAKIFEQNVTKHKKILKILKYNFSVLTSRRLLSCRITITGRISTSSRSRVFYLTKKDIPTQTFSNNINYAAAQSKSPRGSFSVKVWYFY